MTKGEIYHAHQSAWKGHGYPDLSVAIPAIGSYFPAQIISSAPSAQVGPNGLYSVSKRSLASLSNYSGTITLTTPQGITGQAISGQVYNHLGANSDTLASCWVMGPTSPAYGNATGLIDSTSSTAGVLNVIDTLMQPQAYSSTYSYLVDGIIGHNFTINRCEITRTVDGVGISNTNAVNVNAYVYASYIHDLSGILLDPSHTEPATGSAPGPTHNDGVQMQSGNYWEIVGNTILGFVDPTWADGATWNSGTSNSGSGNARQFGPNYQCNSAIQTNQNVSGNYTTVGAKINYNYFDGGIETLNLSSGNLNPSWIIDELIGNHFGRNAAPYPGEQLIEYNAAYLTIKSASGNVYDDNGAAVTIKTTG